MKDQKKDVQTQENDFPLEWVPEEARKGFRSMFFVMLGFTFFSASMSADAAGAIPHFEFTREYSVESLNICFELCRRRIKKDQ